MQPEHRPGDEVEPAPIDQQIEALEAGVFLVAVDRVHHLGAGEDMGDRLAALAPGSIVFASLTVSA